MARRTPMQKFARWHIWLGWVAALPILLWVISGLFMALRPNDQVRGVALRVEDPAVEGHALAFPRLSGPVSKVTLTSEAGVPTWIVTDPDKQPRRYAALSGAALGTVDEAEARRIAAAAFAGKEPIIAMRRFAADAPPIDLRHPRPSWQATFADGTHIYVDATSGEVLALRTRFWRAYDFMWGLHIMDPQTREETSNVLLWLFGGLALISSIFGTTLLFRRRKARG